jgi:hypothetical protein
MPSRAVLRRKAKKEAKKGQEPAPKSTIAPSKPEVIVIPAAKAVTAEDLVRTREPQRPRPPVACTQPALAPAEKPPIDTSSMTRKERHRHLLRQRLERQISRINKTAPRPAAVVVGTAVDGQPATSAEQDGESLRQDTAHVAETQLEPLRHDPKFANGTFWRDRKEKKKRTLFVGNMPARSFHKASAVIELIRSVVEASEEASALDCSRLVEHVDFLGQKMGSVIHHAYVTFSSIAAATVAHRLLDGLPVENQKLRVNFSGDKQMRSIAIKKRTGGR